MFPFYQYVLNLRAFTVELRAEGRNALSHKTADGMAKIKYFGFKS